MPSLLESATQLDALSLRVPFTPAHVAAVLPLISRDEHARRRWLDATCLVAGSVAPDFEYFLHARMESNVSHTLLGLFVFDVPIALGIAALFHVLVRDPLARALPSSITSRFARFLSTRWSPPLHVAIASALIGAVTHVVWDACSHRTGYVVRMLPFLEQHVIVDGFPLYRLLQHASTAMGLLAIAIVVARMPRRSNALSSSAALHAAGTAGTEARPTRVFVAVPLIFGACAAVARILVEDGGRVYGHAIAAFISGALVGICVAAFIVRVRRRAKVGHPAGTART